MGWADTAIVKLRHGLSATVTPHGNSMTPLIKSGEKVNLEPIRTPLAKGDVVLVKVRGRVYLHLISALDGDRVQIANNRGGINGWVSVGWVFGRMVKEGSHE